MARTLRIFKNISPNLQGNTYYYFKKPLDYFNLLSEEYKYIDITIDNYRINTGVIKIAKDTFSVSELCNASYIIEYFFNPSLLRYTILRCYHISQFEEAENYFLYVDVDLWATYIAYAELSNINVLRCNRNIGNGVYDRIDKTIDINFNENVKFEPIQTGLPVYPDTDNIAYTSDSEVSIVFIAQRVIATNLAGTDYVQQLQAFACQLDYLRGLVPQTMQDRFNSVEIAQQIISGITSCATSEWYVNNDVTVLKAYLIPTYCLSYSGYATTMYSKSYVSESNQISITANLLNTSLISRSFLIDVSEMDINKKYYIGVINDGLELTHFTQDNYVKFNILVNKDSVQVVVKQGNNMKDLSSHFEVALIGNAQSTDAIQKVAWWSKYIANMMSNLSSMASQKTSFGAIAKGVSYIGNTLGELENKTQATGTIQNNDGAITFNWYNEENYYCNYPFYFTKFESVVDELIRARIYGASFNEIYHDLYLLEDFDLLGRGDLETTYVVANIHVAGIPTTPQKYIESAFNNGIYIEFIS